MKKDVTLILLLLLATGFSAAAAACDMDVTLLNQDPYPAIPGEYVKLVFQVEGLDSPNCNDITFNLPSEYPIEFNPGETGFRTFKKVDYIEDYESNLIIPYEVRINENALDGANSIEVEFHSKNDALQSKEFNIEVDDPKAEFEIYVKDYSYSTNELTLEILNIAESDAELLRVEIPKQDSIIVKGSNIVIAGDIDSNEYTTVDIEAILTDGEFIVNIIYSDTINQKRSIEKTVTFDSSYFTNRKADEKTTGTGTYIFYAIIIALLVWWGYRKFSKKKK